MKHLHNINKGLFILNGVLFLTIIYGLLFLMVTGSVQILINIYLYSNYKKQTPEIKKQLNLHSILSALLLTALSIAIYFPNLNYDLNSILSVSAVALSIPLGIYHFAITSKIQNHELQLNSV